MMQAALSTATVVGGAGVEGVLTRELAKAHPSHPQRVNVLLSAASRGVFLMALLGAVLSFGVISALSGELGFDSPLVPALLALGVLASIVTANLRAALSGLGLLRVVASLGGASGVVTLLAALLLTTSGNREPLWVAAVVVLPIVQLGVTLIGFRRAPVWQPLAWRESVSAVRALIRMSKLLALAGILPPAAQLLVRTLVREELNPVAFGCFQAAMALAATSVSVLASSVGPSVLPRLSAASGDSLAMSAVVNEQTTVYLTLFAPVAIGIVALPDLVIRLLFSSEFAPVAGQLSWQMVGEVVRLPCWVLATALTARSRTRAYLLVEAVSLALFVIGAVLAARTHSLEAVGVALSIATGFQFALLVWLLRPDGVRLAPQVLLRIAIVVLIVIVGAAWARENLLVRGLLTFATAVTALAAARVVLRIFVRRST